MVRPSAATAYVKRLSARDAPCDGIGCPHAVLIRLPKNCALLGSSTAQPNELGQPGANEATSTPARAALQRGTVPVLWHRAGTAAAAPRHAAAPHRHAPHDSPCADGRADAPTPDPTDGYAAADAISVAAAAQLDAVAHAVAGSDAAADTILFARVRAVAGTVRVAVGGPVTPPDAPAPDGRADAEADPEKFPFYFTVAGVEVMKTQITFLNSHCACVFVGGTLRHLYDSLWRPKMSLVEGGLRSNGGSKAFCVCDVQVFLASLPAACRVS